MRDLDGDDALAAVGQQRVQVSVERIATSAAAISAHVRRILNHHGEHAPSDAFLLARHFVDVLGVT